MVIKNLENKIKLVGIICTTFLVGCIIISVSSIWTARTMVTDAQKKGVRSGRQRTNPREPHDNGRKRSTWKPRATWRCSTISFSLYLRTTNISATRWRKRCTWWMRQDWHSTTRSKKRDFTPIYWGRVRYSLSIVTA